jgi:hypothetical protein
MKKLLKLFVLVFISTAIAGIMQISIFADSILLDYTDNIETNSVENEQPSDYRFYRFEAGGSIIIDHSSELLSNDIDATSDSLNHPTGIFKGPVFGSWWFGLQGNIISGRFISRTVAENIGQSRAFVRGVTGSDDGGWRNRWVPSEAWIPSGWGTPTYSWDLRP